MTSPLFALEHLKQKIAFLGEEHGKKSSITLREREALRNCLLSSLKEKNPESYPSNNEEITELHKLMVTYVENYLRGKKGKSQSLEEIIENKSIEEILVIENVKLIANYLKNNPSSFIRFDLSKTFSQFISEWSAFDLDKDSAHYFPNNDFQDWMPQKESDISRSRSSSVSSSGISVEDTASLNEQRRSEQKSVNFSQKTVSGLTSETHTLPITAKKSAAVRPILNKPVVAVPSSFAKSKPREIRPAASSGASKQNVLLKPTTRVVENSNKLNKPAVPLQTNKNPEPTYKKTEQSEPAASMAPIINKGVSKAAVKSTIKPTTKSTTLPTINPALKPSAKSAVKSAVNSAFIKPAPKSTLNCARSIKINRLPLHPTPSSPPKSSAIAAQRWATPQPPVVKNSTSPQNKRATSTPTPTAISTSTTKVHQKYPKLEIDRAR